MSLKYRIKAMDKKKINFKDSFWSSFVITILVGLAVLVIIFSFMSRSVTSEEFNDVFYSSLDKQLQSEFGFRFKELSQENTYQSQTTVIKANTEGAISREVVVSDNQTPGQESFVVTEGVGTKDADFIKYVIVEGENAEQAKDIVGKWVVNESAPGQPAQFLATAIFGSPIMTGKIDKNVRNNIMDSIKGEGNTNTNPVYIASSSVVRENGKKLYKYDVEFNLESYIPLYQEYLRSINLSNLADELAVPEGDSKITMTVFVDPATKGIIKVVPTGEQQPVVEYYNFNRYIPIPAVPDRVDMTYMEMQQALGQ